MPLPKTINRVTGEPSWRYRRLMVYAIIIFCMIVLLRMIDRTDSDLNSVIATGILWLMATVVLGYVGFATVQDVGAIITMRSARPYATEPTPPAVVEPDAVVTSDPPPSTHDP